MEKSGLSLRLKLLALLITLPIVSLGIYLLMASNLFVTDKRAYVYDTSVLASRSLASQVKLEINSYKRLFEPISTSIDPNSFRFSDYARELFYQQRHVEWTIVYRKESSRYVATDNLYLSNRGARDIRLDPSLLLEMQQLALKSGIVIKEYSHRPRHFLIMQTFQFNNKGGEKYIVLSLYRATDIYEAFATPGLYSSYLMSKHSFLSITPKFIRKGDHIVQVDSVDFFKNIFAQKLPEGTAEIVAANGRPALVSYADVGEGDLVVASVVDKGAAYSAVDNLLFKSILFFVALICLTLIISVISSIGLTAALGDLVKATKDIAQGKFDIDLHNITSRDEIGVLATGFKTMANEVSRLLNATAEQARMEMELETVKVVQETLFPDSDVKLKNLNVKSHFEPASECGGDWFHYSEIGGKAFLWIGDATGHGAPAALITSAAKSASAIIEMMPEATPGQALKIMNHALNATAKGNILMTFFLATVDLETGEMVYANASHEFPYVIPQKEKLTKKDLIPLCDASGYRLGEQQESDYNECTHQLNPGDTILFYTDGIIDLQNEEGSDWGERKFLKALVKAASSSKNLGGKLKSFKKELSSYRNGALLVDDITLFLVQWDPPKVSSAKPISENDEEVA